MKICCIYVAKNNEEIWINKCNLNFFKIRTDDHKKTFKKNEKNYFSWAIN